MGSIYAAEKLYDAVYELAVHPNGIKDRLKVAIIKIAALEGKDIPPQYLTDFISIRNKLTSAQPVGGEGNYHASINAMSEDDAVDLAKAILDLQSKVS